MKRNPAKTPLKPPKPFRGSPCPACGMCEWEEVKAGHGVTMLRCLICGKVVTDD